MSGAPPDPEWDELLAVMGAAAQPPPNTLRDRVLTASTPLPFAFVRAAQGIWLPVGEGAHAKALFLDSRDRWSTRLVRLNDGVRLTPPALGGWCLMYVISGSLACAGEVLGAGDMLTGADEWRAAGDTLVLEQCYSQLPTGSPQRMPASALSWQTATDGIRVAPVGLGGPGIVLVDAEPDAVLPEHTYEGVEELFVLRGSCVVEGEVMESGDYHRAIPGSTHHPTRAGSEGCLLLTALRIDAAA